MLILLTSAAIATISMTISQSILFKPIRDYFNIRLLRCPYCLSHWIAFIAALVITSPLTIVNWIIMSFALVCFASILSLFIAKFLDTIDHE